MDTQKSCEEMARKTVESCPVDHVQEGIAGAIVGMTTPVGSGCACQRCIAKALEQVAKERDEEIGRLKESISYFRPIREVCARAVNFRIDYGNWPVGFFEKLKELV